ncbi:amino acid deaminase [Cellulomonas sp. PS-H5]|uniref:amino acid deaminase n=1 Tax=Cellulomonas sp. PS-H5 TaxID=2820400 RepID=UPI001C4F64BD|nr:amino acid deaminase [Cellulomonas sp. PS-H5]MBW0254392.1 amino acid deaminase [Cellulomonas sp. PS-H5]
MPRDARPSPAPCGPAPLDAVALRALDAEALRALDAAARAAADDPDGALHLSGPVGWLAAQVDADRERGTFGRWGRSSVVDELTGAPVVPGPVLAWLQRRAGLPVEFPGADAGLAHVYGYLLSTAATPFGLKRDRWTGGALAGALGLDPRHLLPWHRPDGRTLLERVTDAVLPVLADPDAGALLVRDDAVLGTADALRTVVVRAQGVGGGALVYGWVGPGGVRPVTAFPVDASPRWLRETGSLPPVPRYNVLVP